MIDHMALLRMIMENNPGQPPSFILEQYAIYKAGLTEINSRVAGKVVCADVVVERQTPPETQEYAPTSTSTSTSIPAPQVERDALLCGYIKRQLKVQPEEAIQDNKIICCICGKECQTLTEKHLSTHNGLTREGYTKLCGYPTGQPLISRNHLAWMKANVLKAQMVRKNKAQNNTAKIDQVFENEPPPVIRRKRNAVTTIS